jgi:hypothetical protein
VRRILISCLVACSLLAMARPSAAQALLPPSFGSWSAGAAQPVTLEQIAGADAAAIREYGFKAIERQEYARGADTLAVTLYRMMDPSAAYGAFTYLRTAGMAPQSISRYAAASSNRALVVVGNLLIGASGATVAHSIADLGTLAASLKSKADPTPFPSIALHLPEEGMVPGSEHYFLGPIALHSMLPVGSGDWLGFSKGAEAISARFRKGSQEVTLLIVEYPTQQIASRQFDAAQQVLHSSSDATVPDYLFLSSERDDDLISIVFGHAPSTFANTLVKKVVFGHNVTWNEPSFKATELSWPTYVIGAFTGAGIIMVFSIVSGIGFGIIRVVIKTLFPGKVFDRHGQIEVIQLGLTGKRITTKDFY